jgi:hypothetical protein
MLAYENAERRCQDVLLAVLSSLGVNGCLAYEAALLGTTVPANGIMLTRSANPGGMIHTNYLRDSSKSIDRSFSPQSCSDSRQHFSGDRSRPYPFRSD